ncbi:MAG: Stk1 family PASTA domain-containing Ser/Thr kinase [Thermoleophilia bacterium]
MIGRVFEDRYEIIRKLGAGGMAEVYLAHDRHLGRDVALKVLQSRFADDEQFVERFRREASSAAGLNHPNIVQIYDRGQAEGTYYIAMEYLEGRSLKDIIVRFAPLRADHLISITTQILEALRFAHRKDVVHRDIKPQNIIVDDEGRVKVTDFGIARAGSATSMTETGSILGTAHYLSPEQAQGGHSEAASDLYSLGVVMYEMATGALPFTGDNPVAIAMRHVNEAPTPPHQLAPDVPENIERIILRALAKRPEQRYLTAAAFLEDLYRTQRGESVAPPPPFLPADGALAYSSEEHTRVRAPGAGDTTGVYGVPADPTQVRPPTDRRRPGPPEESFPHEPPARRSVWPWVMVIAFLILLVGSVYVLATTLTGGDDTVVVPGLAGLSPDAAEKELGDLGLKMEIKGEEQTDAHEPGLVARQDPEQGEKLRPGETVGVWLAVGKEKVDVPNLVGKTEVQALVELGKVGLEIDPVSEPSEDQPEGAIFKQEPAFPNKVSVGSAVRVWVSTGPSGTEVDLPNVVGMTEQRALTLLDEELKLTVTLLDRASEEEAGIVVEQFPKAGQRVGEGSRVTVYVSDGSLVPDVSVPDVIGLFKGPAGVKLGDAGFRVRTVEQPEDGYDPGKVFDQDPSPGAKAKKGSTVTIIVATPVPTTTATTTTTTTATTTTTTNPPSSSSTVTSLTPPTS